MPRKPPVEPMREQLEALIPSQAVTEYSWRSIIPAWRTGARPQLSGAVGTSSYQPRKFPRRWPKVNIYQPNNANEKNFLCSGNTRRGSSIHLVALPRSRHRLCSPSLCSSAIRDATKCHDWYDSKPPRSGSRQSLTFRTGGFGFRKRLKPGTWMSSSEERLSGWRSTSYF